MQEHRDYSDKTAYKIDEVVQKLVSDAQDRARELFNKHRTEVDKIVNVLLDKETIEKEEFEAIVTTAKKDVTQS